VASLVIAGIALLLLPLALQLINFARKGGGRKSIEASREDAAAEKVRII
jgi:hypothetical protein